ESEMLRVETGFREGDRVTPYYDALIAKLIAWGETRGEALNRLQTALAETQVAGIASNRDLLLGILTQDEFATQPPDTGFIERHRLGLLKAAEPSLAALVAAGLAILLDQPAAPAGDPHSPWQHRDGWRLFGATRERFSFRAGGQERMLAL